MVYNYNYGLVITTLDLQVYYIYHTMLYHIIVYHTIPYHAIATLDLQVQSLWSEIQSGLGETERDTDRSIDGWID